jgi:integrase
MGLIKVGKYYWLDIRIKGKRIRRSLRTSNKLEALDKYGEKKQELLDEYELKRIKFSDFCKQYLEWAWSAKPASALREQQRLRKISDFFIQLDIIYLTDITPYHIEKLKAWLKEEKREKTIIKRSKATINRYLQLLRGLFYKAIDWEVYQGPNPLKKIKFFKESPQIKVPSPVQIKKILKAARDISKKPQSALQKVFFDMIQLALNTGMRKSEILNLEWKDIKGKELTVKGKGDNVRTIPLNMSALIVIERQPKKSNYVFDIPNRHQQDLLRRTVNQIKKRTGIDFHFHLLRHYFTTSLVEKGVDFITVSALLGHSRIMTSLIYSHTDRERKREAVDLLG